MLGGDKQSSASTVSHNYISDAKIEEEIAEEINKLSSQVIGSSGHKDRKKSLEVADDDLDGYSDDGFDNPDKLVMEDENGIVDEVAEADDLQMLEAEICNTALAK